MIAQIGEATKNLIIHALVTKIPNFRLIAQNIPNVPER